MDDSYQQQILRSQGTIEDAELYLIDLDNAPDKVMSILEVPMQTQDLMYQMRWIRPLGGITMSGLWFGFTDKGRAHLAEMRSRNA